MSEVECCAAAVRVHAVPLRKVIYELSPYYCLIVCKQEGGQREHASALTSLCLCLSLFAFLTLSLCLSVRLSVCVWCLPPSL